MEVTKVPVEFLFSHLGSVTNTQRLNGIILRTCDYIWQVSAAVRSRQKINLNAMYVRRQPKFDVFFFSMFNFFIRMD